MTSSGDRDKRGSVRVGTRLEVLFRADGVQSTGFVDDLSESGMWLDTPQPLPLQSDVHVEFRLGGDEAEHVVAARGTVVRVEPTIGMAVAFRGLPPKVAEMIRFYVAERYFSAGADPSPRD